MSVYGNEDSVMGFLVCNANKGVLICLIYSVLVLFTQVKIILVVLLCTLYSHWTDKLKNMPYHNGKSRPEVKSRFDSHRYQAYFLPCPVWI